MYHFECNVYIIEDLVSHRKIVVEILKKLSVKFYSKIFPIDDYIKFYNDINFMHINNTYVFIIDIDLNTFNDGLDYAKKFEIKMTCIISYF